MVSWLHAIAHLRNLCAHHSRIWNRVFAIKPSVPKTEEHHIAEPRKLYNHAVAIQILLKRVSGDNHWADRLQACLEGHPEIPIRHMGFPDQWRDQRVWHST